ncbi:MAG: hypothetical protein KGR26_13775 [Cyanobacteria bacterium REEB65]|nr:hypothetical protein [Cyanobacteria bacterium REEB65]
MAGNPQPQSSGRQRLLCPIMSTPDKPTACVEQTCAMWNTRHSACGMAAPAVALEYGFDEIASLIRDIRGKL